MFNVISYYSISLLHYSIINHHIILLLHCSTIASEMASPISAFCRRRISSDSRLALKRMWLKSTGAVACTLSPPAASRRAYALSGVR